MGKSSINGPCSMAMLNNQKVYINLNVLFKLSFSQKRYLRFYQEWTQSDEKYPIPFHYCFAREFSCCGL